MVESELGIKLTKKKTRASELLRSADIPN
jgi:hypothetical protein